MDLVAPRYEKQHFSSESDGEVSVSVNTEQFSVVPSVPSEKTTKETWEIKRNVRKKGKFIL